MIQPISNSKGVPTMFPPVILIVAISMVKDGYEDYKRH